MAQGLPQVDTVTGLPMVDSVTQLPIVTGAGDGCCCGTIKHCFQQFTVRWTCASKTFGTVTAGAKSCLPSATPLTWTKYFSALDGTYCDYYKYVDMGGANCSVDGDCTGRADATTPAAPSSPKDCCQNCCISLYQSFPTDRDCCFSDLMSWSGGPMPTLTYLGTNPDIQSTIDWYNGAIAGNSYTTPSGVDSGHDGCATQVYTVTSGTDSFNLYVSVSGVVFDVGGTWGAYSPINALSYNHRDCCYVGGSWGASPGGDLTVSHTTFRFDVTNNFCCGDTQPVNICYKLPNACNGVCNPLP